MLIIYSIVFPEVFAIPYLAVTARIGLVLAIYCKVEWGKELLDFLLKFLPPLKGESHSGVCLGFKIIKVYLSAKKLNLIDLYA